MKNQTIEILSSVKEHLNSEGFKKSSRIDSRSFIRKRSLDFVTVMTIILNNVTKSLSVELTKFLCFFKKGVSATKQAFNQARYKVKWEGFVELNDVFIKSYYNHASYELYKDKYLLLATDGSDYELPYEKSLIEAFGSADNGIIKQPICMAKGVKIWDLLNKLTISSYLGHYDIAEINHFKKAWTHAKSLLEGLKKGRLLLLADMHYPAFWLIHDLSVAGVDFLFRCPPTFCREIKQFMQGSKKDSIIKIPVAEDPFRKSSYKIKTGQTQIPQYVQVRAIKFTRPTGEQTCLITSVQEHDLSYQDICDLYPYRWGIEVSYHFDKNRVEIENFSAKTPQGIRQDWYANTLTTNLVQLLIQDAQKVLDTQLQGKDNKYEYQINQSVALGIIKDEIPKLLFGNVKPTTFYNDMIKLIVKFREPVRPNRTFPREKKHKIKFSKNRKAIKAIPREKTNLEPSSEQHSQEVWRRQLFRQ